MKTRRRRCRDILKIVAMKGKASLGDIRRELNAPPSTLSYWLNVLVWKGLLTKEGKGIYRLKRQTPLGFLSKNIPKAYVGLVGMRLGREKPEWITALEKLSKNCFIIEKVVLISSPEALSEWEEYHNPSIEWRVFAEDVLFSPKEAEKCIRKVLEEVAETHALVADITSGPRTAGISLYRVASEFYAPIIYLREDTQELVWIKTVEEIVKDYLKTVK